MVAARAQPLDGTECRQIILESPYSFLARISHFLTENGPSRVMRPSQIRKLVERKATHMKPISAALSSILIFTFGSCAQVEPAAGTWKTWVLLNGRELRLPPAPTREQTASEIAWLKNYIAETRVHTESQKQMRYWTAGSPAYRWVELMLQQIYDRGMSSPRNARAMALMNIAMYDATIAAWDSKYAYNRLRPAQADPTITVAVDTPNSPSYPSEIAVTAAAASEVLAYLFPADASMFRSLAEEASRASMTAGINYPSDVTAGLQLGRAVAAKVIDVAHADGSQAVWSGTVPTGAGMWIGTTPSEPLAGTWKTWVLTSVSQFRPGPPPAWDSPQKRAELEEIKNFSRTFASNQKGFYYQSPEGIYNVFYDVLSRRIFENDLDKNPPRAVRAYALAAIAHNDAAIACWDAKYTYWAARPNQLDASITTLFPNPGHPTYPSAHGCFSGAIARTIGRLFPDFSEAMDAKATEAAESRFWSGIHFRSDLEIGLTVGRSVGDAVIERASSDGSVR